MRWLTRLLHRRPRHARDLEHTAPNGDRVRLGIPREMLMRREWR
jgi:hypothetical protein